MPHQRHYRYHRRVKSMNSEKEIIARLEELEKHTGRMLDELIDVLEKKAVVRPADFSDFLRSRREEKQALRERIHEIGQSAYGDGLC